MAVIEDIVLGAGIDIPFPEAQTVIHQPTIKEIAYIGEETFFIGCELLKFSKNSLMSEDKNRLKDKTDFDIIMSIINDKQNPSSQRSAVCASLVLMLLFQDTEVLSNRNSLVLRKFIEEEVNGEKQLVKQDIVLNNSNYARFKEILLSMFCFKDKEEEYNPAGEMASKIADKLKKGKQKVNAQKGKQEKISIFSRYASILAVGLQKDINILMQYTVYQLYDEFERFELKVQYDIHLQARMAGAKDLKDVDNWMKDIH